MTADRAGNDRDRAWLLRILRNTRRRAEEPLMSLTITTMLGCDWSARRIQRYLDADPSGLLTAEEVRRLESHLAHCARCSAAAEEYRRLRLALDRWRTSQTPDEAMGDRARLAAERLIEADTE